MSRVLVVKHPPQSFPSSKPLPEDLCHVDKICHGLLTQALFSGFLEKKKAGALLIKPDMGPVDFLVLVSKVNDLSGIEIEKNFTSIREVFWSGDFSQPEIKEASKYIGKLKKWEDAKA